MGREIQKKSLSGRAFDSLVRGRGFHNNQLNYPARHECKYNARVLHTVRRPPGQCAHNPQMIFSGSTLAAIRT